MVEEDIFSAALDRTDPHERTAYLDRACGGDLTLRARLEALLQSHAQAGNFLDTPVLPNSDTGVYLAPPDAATQDTSIAERAGSCIGPYQLLHKIGEGGMGLVWLAEQQEPVRRKVAL